MPDGVDAGVDCDQALETKTMLDGSGTEPEREQLGAHDEAVLPSGEGSDGGLEVSGHRASSLPLDRKLGK